MPTLVKHADLYGPEHLGVQDVLLEGSRIAAIGSRLEIPTGYPGLTVLEAEGRKMVPGLIDLHVHITGGGGEDGFSSRAPESRLSDFIKAGVTTVLGLLGTDGIARSLETLYAKACGLEEEGLTTFMLTGSYGYPTATLCGSVERDLVLIHKVVGAKIAISDHRSSEVTYEELLKTATMVRRGGMLARKAGILTIHMGDGRENLDKLFRAAKESEVPLRTFLPTHVARNAGLLQEAIRWIQAGGQADFTAGEPTPGGTARLMVQALDAGASPDRMTLSSDAFGSQPRFDAQGNCIGLCYATSEVLHEELLRLVRDEGLPLELALQFLTRNPARVLQMDGRKGELKPGSDADFLLLDDNLELDTVFAKGRCMMLHHQLLAKGRFE